MPDRSGLPSGVRGAGPSRTGLPSFRGTSGVGYDGHWAPSDGATATQIASTPTAVIHRVIHEPPAESLFLDSGSLVGPASFGQRVRLRQVMSQVTDVVVGEKPECHGGVVTDGAEGAATGLWNPLDDVRKVTVVRTP